MSQETELKLAVPEDQVNALKQHEFWSKYGEPQGTIHLGNTYFDTADMRLNQARVALRIREKNGQYFQTLKTKGESVNGLTRHGEWEWSLASATLDHEGLKDIWPEALQDVSSETVIPLFSTDFNRTLWNIEWHQPYAKIEAALDLGAVKAGNSETPICELELELIEGDEAALSLIANEFIQTLNLSPSDKSKAERGFELLEKTRQQ